MSNLTKCPQCGANMRNCADGSIRCDYCGAAYNPDGTAYTPNVPTQTKPTQTLAARQTLTPQASAVFTEDTASSRKTAFIFQIITLALGGLLALCRVLMIDDGNINAPDLGTGLLIVLMQIIVSGGYLMSIIPTALSCVFGGFAMTSKNKKRKLVATILEIAAIALTIFLAISLSQLTNQA